jgi:hypothetical protein
LAPPQVLMIQRLNPHPRFYTNTGKYLDARSAFATEIESMPQIPDPISQRLWVSDPVLLKNLIDSENAFISLKGVNPCSLSASRLPWQSKSRGKSFIDHFIDSHCSSTIRTTYRSVRIHCYLTGNLAWFVDLLMVSGSFSLLVRAQAWKRLAVRFY